MWIAKQSNRGSALISALFIMTLVAIAATAMSTRLQLDIYRTHLTLTSDKLYLASQAVRFWAMAQLADPKKHFNMANEHARVDMLPKNLQTIYPEIQIQGELIDLQARFNLNNLIDKTYQVFFYQFLENLLPEKNPSHHKQLIAAISSWFLPYQPGHANNPFFTEYLRLKQPYYPSQQLLKHVSEFRLIKGVHAELYETLLPYFTALPETTPINLNTAPKNLLQALGSGLTETQVQELLEARGEKGLKNLKKIVPLLKKLNIRAEHLTIESQYFMSIAKVRHQDMIFVISSIFKRTKADKGKISVSLLSEELN